MDMAFPTAKHEHATFARRFAGVLCFGLFALSAVTFMVRDSLSVFAVSPPNLLTYQGRVLNANGVPVADPTANMQFRLFDAVAAGTCLWSNDSSTCASNADQTVTLTSGLFSENLGDTGVGYAAILDSVFADNASVFLEVEVNGEVLTPRKAITAAAYALNADTLDGLDSTDFLTSGSVFIQNGNSFGAPAVLGTNDTFPLSFETDGTTRVTINTSGNVGIGTASPGVPLDVVANDATTNDVSYILNLRHDTTGTAASGIGTGIQLNAERANGTDVGVAQINGIITDATAVDTALAFTTRVAAGSLTEKMRIDANGNVGIGTTTPDHDLTISRDANAQLAIRSFGTGVSPSLELVNSRGTAASPAAVQTGDGIGDIDFCGQLNGVVDNYTCRGIIQGIATENWAPGAAGNRLQFSTTANTTSTAFVRMTIDQSGFVGIATSTPATLLNVSTTGSPTIQVDTSTTTGLADVAARSGGQAGLVYADMAAFGSAAAGTSSGISRANLVEFTGGPSNSAMLIRQSANAPLAFSTNDTERMRILSTGEVGIGTTTPTGMLQISKNQNGSTFAAITNTTSGTAAASYLEFTAGATSSFFGSYSALFSNAGDTTFANFGTLENTTPNGGLLLSASGQTGGVNNGNILMLVGGNGSPASQFEVFRATPTEVVVNDASRSTVDFRAETDGNANGIFLDASAETIDLVGGSGSTGCSIDASGNLSCTGTISGSGSGTLQSAYDNDTNGGDATITTNATDGDIVIAGDQDFRVTTTGNSIFDTNTLFVDSSANRVGIGTAAPATTLDVSGAFGQVDVGDAAGGNAGRITLRRGSDGALCSRLGFLSAGSDGMQLQNCNGELRLEAASSDATNIVTVYTNGSERTRVDNSGNYSVDTNTLYVDAANNRVGVGTSSPTYEFESRSAGDVVNVAAKSTSSTSGTAIRSENDSGNVLDIDMLASAQSTTGGAVQANTALIATNQGVLNIQSLKASGPSIGFYTSTVDTVSGTERARIGSTEFAINDGSNDYDFRAETDGNANGIFLDASAETIDLVGGSGSTGCTVDASGNLSCTGTLSGSGGGAAFVQNGNSFGTSAVLGTNDNNTLSFETNNVTKASVGRATDDIFTVTGGTLAASKRALAVSGTLSGTSGDQGMRFDITSAGSGASNVEGGIMVFGAGYTGTQVATAFDATTLTAGTGNNFNFDTSFTNPFGNSGLNGFAGGTTSGLNIGSYAEAANGTTSVGAIGKSITAKASGTNIGVIGVGRNTSVTSPIEIGGYFGLFNSTPTFDASAGLIASNGSTTNSIFLARDNNSTVFTIADGGTVTTAGNILPSTDDTFTLGDNTHRWADIFLGPASIHIGATGDESLITYSTGSDLLTFQNSVDSANGFQFLDADGGTPILNVDTTNEFVGIGTATPATTLEIETGAALTIAQVQNTTDTGIGRFIVRDDLGSDFISLRTNGSAAAGTFLGYADAGTSYLESAGGSAMHIRSSATAPIVMSVNSIEGFTLTTTEAVVNQAANNYDFRVEGQTNSSAFLVDASTDDVIVNDNGSAATDFIARGDTNANLLFVDASADFVGIGTATPSTVLNIVTATPSTVVQAQNTTTTGVSRFILRDDGGSNNVNLRMNGSAVAGTFLGYTEASAAYLEGSPASGTAFHIRNVSTAPTVMSVNGTEAFTLTTTEAVVNQAANNYDFRAETQTNANGIFLDASAETIALVGGSGSTGCTVDASGNLSCSGTISGSGGSSQAFVQDGNSFGAAATLGTNDANFLNFETNNVVRFTIGSANGNITSTATDFSCTDCMNFDDMSDALEIDASTSIATDGSETFTLSNGSSGDTIVDLTSTGDFEIKDGGTTFWAFEDNGKVTFDTEATTGMALLLADDSLSSGKVLEIETISTDRTSGDLFRSLNSPVITTDSTISGNDIEITRLPVSDGAGTDLTVSGSMALFNDNPSTQNGAAAAHTGNTVQITRTQSSGVTSSGDALGIITDGSGDGIQMTHAGTGIGAWITMNSVDNPGGAGIGNQALVLDTNETGSSDKMFIIRSDADGTPDTEFSFSSDGNALADGSFTGGGADYAEYYKTSDAGIAAAEVVCMDVARPGQVVRCGNADAGVPIGIVSTKPAFLANGSGAERDLSQDPTYKAVGLTGQVPVRISTENGEIAVGDPLAPSAVHPGYAMKAVEAGMIIGYALEPSHASLSDASAKVLVFAHVGYSASATPNPNAGTSNQASSLSGNLSSLNMSGDIYMAGNRIIDVDKIAGLNGTWSVDSTGKFTTKGSYDVVIKSYQNEDVTTHAMLSTEHKLFLSGTAELVNGEATVSFETVDPKFNDVISTSAPMQVVTTPNGPAYVYVASKDHDGFSVKQLNGADSGITFDWMVTAFRKDYEPASPAPTDVATPSAEAPPTEVPPSDPSAPPDTTDTTTPPPTDPAPPASPEIPPSDPAPAPPEPAP